MNAPNDAPGALVCPGCARIYPEGERFCKDCKLPLVLDSRVQSLQDVSDRHRRARKVKPQLAEGRLVRVAGARNQAEAEFIQGLLLEEGVPSMLKRSAGFDVPDFLAAGPRDVLVPEAGAQTAREVLLQADLLGAQPGRAVAPFRLLVGLLAALVIGGTVIWVIADLLR